MKTLLCRILVLLLQRQLQKVKQRGSAKPKPASKTKPAKTMPAAEKEGQKELEVAADEEETPILKKPAAKPKAKAGLKRPAAAPKAASKAGDNKEPMTRKATKYCYHSDGKWGVKLNGKEQCTVGGMKKVVVLSFVFCLLVKKVAII